MQKGKVSIILFFLTLGLYSQLPGRLYDFNKLNDSSKLNVTLNTDYYCLSNTITNDLMNSLFSGNILSDSDKENSFNNLNNYKNYIGYFNLYNVNSTFYFDKIKSYIGFGYSYNDYWSGQLSNGAFSLIFYGNSHFKGETLKLGPTYYTATKYEEFYLIYRTRNIDFFDISLEVGLVKGIEQQTINIFNGELYTSSLGDSVYVDVDMNSIVKQRDDYRDKSANGWGLSVSLNLKYYPDEKNTFIFNLNDAGFVKWNNANLSYSTGSFSFGGMDFDIFSGAAESQSLLSLDSINLMFEGESVNSDFSTILPLRLHLGYQRVITNNIDFNMGMSWHFASARPMGYIAGSVILPFNICLMPYLSFGGFSKLDFGGGISKTIYDKYLIGVDTWFIEPLISERNTSSQGARFYIRMEI